MALPDSVTVVYYHLSRGARNPAFERFDSILYKLVGTIREQRSKLEISDLRERAIVLSVE